MQERFNITFKLPYQIKKEGKYYVSSCPILDVYSQGETRIDAKNNLHEALTVFLLNCLEEGTLDYVLKECGFKVDKMEHKPRKSSHYFDVPLPMVRVGGEICSAPV